VLKAETLNYFFSQLYWLVNSRKVMERCPYSSKMTVQRAKVTALPESKDQMSHLKKVALLKDETKRRLQYRRSWYLAEIMSTCQ
jgi:hypothetical protein